MNDELYIRRCFELAILGLGNCSPNPMVGCVIVSDGKIIGEGYHRKFGEAHAEVNAINDVLERYGPLAADLLKGATAYVSLEPCAHFGKTPPCADLLVKHQLERVVIANTDPFTGVNGKGIEKLKSAGIRVDTDILKQEGLTINRRFFTRITKERPFIILKWAQTQDQFFAPLGAIQQWITGAAAKQLSHLWRTQEDAILVGKKTGLVDNPKLTNRYFTGKNPIRILIDRNLDVPNTYHLFNNDAKTIIFNEIKSAVVDNVHWIQMEDMHYYLPQKIAFQLYLMDIQSIIIEGGANLLQQFIDANLWDEARIFTSTKSWEKGLSSPKIAGEKIEEISVGEDLLTIYKPFLK